MAWKPKFRVHEKVIANNEMSSVGVAIYFGDTGVVTFFDTDVPKWYRVKWDRLGHETNAHQKNLKKA